MYSIQLSKNPIIPQPNEKILGFYVTATTNNDHIVYLRTEHNITSYKYFRSTGTWHFLFSEEIFEGQGEFSLSRYPWSVFEGILPDGDIIVLRHPDGIRFYRADEDRLLLLKEEGGFHEVYQQSLIWGDIFYDKNWWLGVVVRDQDGNIGFNVATRESIQSDGYEDSLLLLNADLDFPSVWKSSNIKFYVTKLRRDEPDVIALETESGLEFYQIGSTFLLECIASVPEISVDGFLLFGNVTHGSYQDIIQVNADQVFLYQYDGQGNNYNLIYSSNALKIVQGGISSNTSVKLLDIDNDGQDDLIFIGTKGLTALRFNKQVNEWELLIDPSYIYGQLVGNLGSFTQSLVLVQNIEGELVWGELVWRDSTTKIKNRNNSTTKIKNRNNSTTEIKDRNNSTTEIKNRNNSTTEIKDRNNSTTEIKNRNNSTTEIKNRNNSTTEIKNRNNSTVESINASKSYLVPHLGNINLARKPIVRWTEQFDINFLKKSINIVSGQTQLNIPLVDTILHGWQIKIYLSYSSSSKSTNSLGVGWSLPLSEDYIFVDWNGSIFPEDASYYWIVQGQTNMLTSTEGTDEIQTFKLEGTEFSISYYRRKQYWIIEDKIERLVYGKKRGGVAQDALRKTLTWPHWRGTGSDKLQQELLISGWYLNCRLNKISGQSLYYYYEINEASTWSGLTGITNGDELQITFEYDNELSPENYYLKRYLISTSLYSQVINFEYKQKKETRFLTAIAQSILSYEEPLLLFEYDMDTLLHTCSAPSYGLTAKYIFNSVVVPYAVGEKLKVFPAGDHSKVAFALNYGILAYKDSNEVSLRITNREMSHTIQECNQRGDFICPSASHIRDFFIKSYHERFLILLKTTQDQILYSFHLLDKVWLSEKKYSFQYNSILSLGTQLVVAAEDNNLWMLDLKGMKTQTIATPRPIKSLALHNRLLFGYDDSDLVIYHESIPNTWRRRIIQVTRTPSTIGETLNKFDLESQLKSNLLMQLQQNSLQVFNNVIMLSGLQERDGQLASLVELFILKEDYTIARKQSFSIDREKIDNLSMSLSSKDGGAFYHVGYVEMEGTYKIRIRNVSGNGIESIRNKNTRADEIARLIEEGNEEEHFLKMSRQMSLLKWKIYVIQLTPRGIYCGDDIFLNMTGVDWNKEFVGSKVTLGKNLELVRIEENAYKLYNRGKLMDKFTVESVNDLVNRYPIYIAFQKSEQHVKVVTFKDDEVDRVLNFYMEQLLQESDFRNLLTNSNRSWIGLKEIRVRPISTLMSARSQTVLNSMTLTDGNTKRNIRYKRYFNVNGETFNETIIEIPGTNNGWCSYTLTKTLIDGNVTRNQHCFEENGTEVPLKPNKDIQNKNKIKVSKSGLLLDRSNQMVIYDFRPYKLTDEMHAYYGFETYEHSSIWKIRNGKFIRKQLTFTGESYLELETEFEDKPAIVEAAFNPNNQDITYLAACWIRTPKSLKINKPIEYLQATITQTNEEIVTILGQTKRISGDWVYLELPIEFRLLKRIYQKYGQFKFSRGIPADNVPKLKIILKVVAPLGEKIDVDHVRFTPLSYDFDIFVYNADTRKPTATIKANGLVERQIYNQLGQELVTLQDNGQLLSFTSCSKSGKLVPGLDYVESVGSCVLFKVENGFYENFGGNRWQVDNNEGWRISPGELWHVKGYSNRIRLKLDGFDSRDVAVSFFTALLTLYSSLSIKFIVGTITLKAESNDYSTLSLPDGSFISPIPLEGEIIVMILNNHLWVWMDGVLLFDKVINYTSYSSSSIILIEANGVLLIRNLIVMNRPSVKVEYRNAFGERTQQITLADSETILVKETLYDDLGRPAIATKMTKICTSNTSALSYRSKFVTNKYSNNRESVWFTGILDGEVNKLNNEDEGYAFKHTIYSQSPLDDVRKLGLPGKEFSTVGPFRSEFSYNSGIAFLDNIFPMVDGFTQRVEYTPSLAIKVSVFDRRWNEVAQYVRVPGFDHLLTTFEYDEENRLVKIIPPRFHEHNKTDTRLLPYIPGSINTPEATKYTYDHQGRLIKKSAPDSGITEFLYNSMGLVQFKVSMNEYSDPKEIAYFEYNERGELVETGLIPEANLTQYLNNSVPSNAQVFQQFDYGEENLDPEVRYRFKHIFTNQDDKRIIDRLKYNSNEQVVWKSTLTLFENVDNDNLTQLKKEYIGDKLRKLVYPIRFGLVHTYNKLNQLIALGDDSDPYRFAKFTYTPSGQLESECHTWEAQLTRNYQYNSPGFLIKITDDFLTEEISYTDGGYGQKGYGNGIIMQMTFNATWTKNADHRLFKVDKLSAGCLRALKELDYLTDDDQPKRSFNPEGETRLPLICSARDVAKLIAEKQVPKYYGHRYAYGNHQELVKAKYFTEDTLTGVLNADSFAVISGITLKQSREIWELLINASFIITDQKQGTYSTLGKVRRSIFRSTRLNSDLKTLNPEFRLYEKPITNLLIEAISQKRILSLQSFTEVFSKWENLSPSPDYFKNVASKIWGMLLNKGYLSQQPNLLNSNFTLVLSSYAKQIPDILRVLRHHWIYDLGQSAFDVQSYGIDANGNHQIFYTGFDRYYLHYKNNTNQVEKITKSSQEFLVKHDNYGNVVKALHKSINNIEYYRLSKRPKRIVLINGVSITFVYDSQGERLLKRVYNAHHKLTHEVHYLRDEQGKVLMDRRTQFGREILTTYIYGPRGLIGFIRNNQFYSTITDHTGSIRLIIKDGQVLVAYDYLPYGNLMRVYCIEPNAHIFYRYTGQEWDEETNLYNYHARLYDPSIGRFYQPDPKEQYFSPYKFSANSPISVVDPDGQFAQLIVCLITGIVGAYLGGAAANHRWNPGDWDFKDLGTYLGIGGGAIVGGLLPVGFTASASVIGIGKTTTLGAGISYVFASATNKDWNPGKWRWDRPETWNSLYQGFGSGSGLVGGIKLVHNFASSLGGRFASGTFLMVSYGTAGTLGYVGASLTNGNNFKFWEWDLDNPETWVAFVNGFDNGLGWPQGFAEIGMGVTKGIPKIFRKDSFKLSQLRTVLKNPGHPLYRTVIGVTMMYIMGGSVNGELDITRWNLASFNTYESILNGAFFGKDLSMIVNLGKRAQMRQFINLSPLYKSIQTTWFSKLKTLLYGVHLFRKNLLYTHFVEELFSSNLFKNKIMNKIKNDPGFIRNNIDNFLNDGITNWKNGKNHVPDPLQRVLLNEATETIYLKEDEHLLMDEIFLAQELDFLKCHIIVKRVAQFLKRACPVKISTEDKEQLAKAIVPSFRAYPKEFMIQHAITTREIDTLTNQAGFPLRTNSDDGQAIVYQFGLIPYQDKLINEKMFSLVPLATSKIDKSDSSIQGYFLVTKDKIRINPFEEIKYIFTSELQGCTLYIKYDEASQIMEIYHHLRSDPDPNEASLDKHYDKAIKWKDYAPDIDPSRNTLTKDTWVTAFLHRDDNRNWRFISQRITYNRDTKAKIPQVNHFEPFGDPIEIPLDLTPSRSQRSRGERSIAISSSANRPTLSMTAFLKQATEVVSSVVSFSGFSYPQPNSRLSSSANRPTLSMTAFLKQATEVVSSVVSFSGFSYPQPNSIQFHDESLPDETLIDIGDSFLHNAQVNGLLAWGVFMVRKWFGYKLTKVKRIDFNQIKLDIASYATVEVYEEALLKCARDCNLGLEMLRIFETSELRGCFVKMARRELVSGELKKIPALFHNVLLSYLDRMNLVTLNNQINILRDKLYNEIPNIQEQLLQMDENCVLFEDDVPSEPYDMKFLI